MSEKETTLSDWVCSICGSDRIEQTTIQDSLGDPAHKLGPCWGCRGTKPMPGQTDHTAGRKPIRHWLSPLVHVGDYKPKTRRPAAAPMADAWAVLPADELKALERPLR